MIAPENGRQLLLDQLPRISSNDSLLTTIIHDLFEKNDRIDESHYGLKTTAKFESLAKDSNLEVSKFESWCGSSMKFLDNVNYDLKRLEEYSVEWWNISILKEALKLGTTLLKLSKMLVDTFDNISVKKFKNSAPCIINQDSTTEELVSSVKGSLSCLQATWANFLTNVVSKAFPNEPEGEATRLVESLCSNAPISAATLRELLIQNTIYCKRRQFLEFLAGFATEQEKLKAGAHFLNNEIFYTTSLNARTLSKDEPAWVPKTLAVVLDTANGIICVGGSQAACDDIPILRGMTKEIALARLGLAFKGIIDKCNDNYRDHMAKVRSQATSDAQQRYKMAVLDNQPEEHNRLPVPQDNATLLCWAFSGYSLEPVQPCLRCQRFYGKWAMYLSPEIEKEQAAALESGIRNSNTKQRTTRTEHVENAPCAETVAAAKVYALRNGKLTLL